MSYLKRAAVMAVAAGLSLSLDVSTKASHVSTSVDNYSHTPALALVLVALFLWTLGIWHSSLVAAGAGFMFGGLCGNGGQILLHGYASDWIPVGGWLTNIADISGAIGLLCCFTGYAITVFRRPPHSAGHPPIQQQT